MRIFKVSVAAATVAIFVAVAAPAVADEFLGSYVARITQDDKHASDGYPLDTAAQMVRQDRASWHKFGRGDAEDEGDSWFGSTEARARLERMLNRGGAMNQATRRAIMRGQPVIRVDVYRQSVRVDILAN